MMRDIKSRADPSLTSRTAASDPVATSVSRTAASAPKISSEAGYSELSQQEIDRNIFLKKEIRFLFFLKQKHMLYIFMEKNFLFATKIVVRNFDIPNYGPENTQIFFKIVLFTKT